MSAAVLAGLCLAGGGTDGRVARAQAPRPLAANGVRYLQRVFDGVSVDVTENVVYGHDVDLPTGRPVDLVLDVHEPRGDAARRRGAVLYVHGGYFTRGDKSQGQWIARELAEYGYVTVSVGYRLRQGDYRTMVEAAAKDLRRAVAWAHENAGEWRLDRRRLFLAGVSAGAITVLETAYTDLAVSPAVPETRVAGVAAIAGGLWNRAEDMSAGDPPLLVVHGTRDDVIPYEEAVALRDRAAEVGIPHLLVPLPGVGHSSFEPERDASLIASFFYDSVWNPVDPTRRSTRWRWSPYPRL